MNIGIGEYCLTNAPHTELVTHALGSCVALIIYCPTTKKTGLAHIVLPDKGRERHRIGLEDKPGYFAQDVVPIMLNAFFQEPGCDRRLLKIHVIGGAQARDKADIFMVGRKNYEKVLSMLQEAKLVPTSIDVGGNYSRTVSISTEDGKVHIKHQKMIL